MTWRLVELDASTSNSDRAELWTATRHTKKASARKAVIARHVKQVKDIPDGGARSTSTTGGSAAW